MIIPKAITDKTIKDKSTGGKGGGLNLKFAVEDTEDKEYVKF